MWRLNPKICARYIRKVFGGYNQQVCGDYIRQVCGGYIQQVCCGYIQRKNTPLKKLFINAAIYDQFLAKIVNSETNVF